MIAAFPPLSADEQPLARSRKLSSLNDRAQPRVSRRPRSGVGERLDSTVPLGAALPIAAWVRVRSSPPTQISGHARFSFRPFSAILIGRAAGAHSHKSPNNFAQFFSGPDRPSLIPHDSPDCMASGDIWLWAGLWKGDPSSSRSRHSFDRYVVPNAAATRI
jgi:hypothetical protein